MVVSFPFALDQTTWNDGILGKCYCLFIRNLGKLDKELVILKLLTQINM